MIRLCLLALVLSLTGCATTEMTGFIDPKYTNYKISSLVIRAKGTSLEETLAVEQKVTDLLSLYNVQVIKYTDIAPPTRKHTLAQEAALLKAAKVDSALMIYIANKDIITSYIPPTYHQGTTTNSINRIGNAAYITTHTTPGYTTGGYSVSNPVMSTFFNLIDLGSGNEIWKGEGFSSGETSHLDLLLHASESAIEDLASKGLLN